MTQNSYQLGVLDLTEKFVGVALVSFETVAYQNDGRLIQTHLNQNR
jgi:hypothetical protein